MTALARVLELTWSDSARAAAAASRRGRSTSMASKYVSGFHEASGRQSRLEAEHKALQAHARSTGQGAAMHSQAGRLLSKGRQQLSKMDVTAHRATMDRAEKVITNMRRVKVQKGTFYHGPRSVSSSNPR